MRGKALALLALFVLSAVSSTLANDAVMDAKQQDPFNPLEVLPRAGGRTLKTWSLLATLFWWKKDKFCLLQDLKFDIGCFSAHDWYNPIYRDDQECHRDRHYLCGKYQDKCQNQCGGLDYYYEEKSWTRYWCPGTCGTYNCGDDYMHTDHCNQFKHLCQPYNGKCYHWYSKPFHYWCQRTCNRGFGKM